MPLETAPHMGAFAPPERVRQVVAGPVGGAVAGAGLVSSSKDDLMQMVASRRGGPMALMDLRPIDAPYYPADSPVPLRPDGTDHARSRTRGRWRESLLSARRRSPCRAELPRRGRSRTLEPARARAVDVPAVRGEPGRRSAGYRVGVGSDRERRDARAEGRPIKPVSTRAGPAAAWTGDRVYEARVRAVLEMEAKQRDSVKMTVTKVLTAGC